MTKFTSHAAMVATLVKPGEDIVASLTPLKAHLWHMASCVMGEVGELVEAEDDQNFLEEFGDIEFYLEGIRQTLHIKRDEVFANKLVRQFSGKDLVIQAANLFDAIKKNVIYNKELNIKDVELALHAIDCVLESLRNTLKITREETLQANLNKLNKRYFESVYSDAQAQARADKSDELQEVVNNATAK